MIAYDIVDDRCRVKMEKLALTFASRVQDSVYEGWLRPADVEDLLRRARPLVKQADDTLRLYPLCANCRESIRSIGRSVDTHCPDDVIA